MYAYLANNFIPDVNFMVDEEFVVLQDAVTLGSSLLDVSHELPQLLSALSGSLGEILGDCDLRAAQRFRVFQNILSVLERLKRHQSRAAALNPRT